MRKRKNYTNTDLLNAIKDAKYHNSVVKAANKYNIPVRTLRYRLSNQLKGYPVRCLSRGQEDSLVTYIKYCAERAFPLTRKMIKAFAREIIRMNDNANTTVNTSKGPSNKWFRSFLKRNPDIALRMPDSIDRGRYGMANETVMTEHFKLLEKCLKDLGIQDKPGNIFNVDETGFGKTESREKVLTDKSRKHNYTRNISTTSHITANICISASGRVLPTFLIYESSFPSGTYREGTPKDWLFGTSPNGYMDKDLFFKWFEVIFLPNCHVRPAVLILDNHESHLSLKLIRKAREEGVELYGLPPHTTHITQTLDVCLFRPLKAKFSELAMNLGYARKDLIIGKAKFAPVLSTAVDKIFSPYTIKEAFRKTGIFPLNSDAIDNKQLAPKCSSELIEKKGNEILHQLEEKEEEELRKQKLQKERKEKAAAKKAEKAKSAAKKATKRKQKITNSNESFPIPTQIESEHDDLHDDLPVLSRPKRQPKKPKRYLHDAEETAAIVGDEDESIICSFCTSREAPYCFK